MVLSSFKTSVILKEKIKKKMDKEKYPGRFYCRYIKEQIFNYINSGKYKSLNAKKSDIGILNANPTAFRLTEQEDKKLKKALNEINRNKNDFLNMMLCDLTKDIK